MAASTKATGKTMKYSLLWRKRSLKIFPKSIEDSSSKTSKFLLSSFIYNFFLNFTTTRPSLPKEGTSPNPNLPPHGGRLKMVARKPSPTGERLPVLVKSILNFITVLPTETTFPWFLWFRCDIFEPFASFDVFVLFDVYGTTNCQLSIVNYQLSIINYHKSV